MGMDWLWGAQSTRRGVCALLWPQGPPPHHRPGRSMGGVCLILQVGLGDGLEGTWKIVLDGPRGSRGFGTAPGSLAPTAGWTLMPFTAGRAQGRSKVMSGEATATCKTEMLGEDYTMARERLAVQGWSSGETGVSTDGEAATRSAQATVGRLRPAVQGHSRPRPPLLEPAELQKATEEDRSHSGWPVQPELQGIVTGNSKKGCLRQVAGAQTPHEVPRAASRGHRLHSRGSTAQWRHCNSLCEHWCGAGA